MKLNYLKKCNLKPSEINLIIELLTTNFPDSINKKTNLKPTKFDYFKKYNLRPVGVYILSTIKFQVKNLWNSILFNKILI